MMTSKIFKFVDSSKTRKYKYLKIETFFYQIENFIHYTFMTIIGKKKCSGGNLKGEIIWSAFCHLRYPLPKGEYL